ncbi:MULTISPECIES: hypothetical protein [unclassified Duganella]|uniref:hypothetical protein n=1 Tax=unclassified Duganella TaxID=2636909 RepID=UPI000E353FEE|nr:MULTISPECIES: hypothetical protein [unclassified Duganella]RFP19560.1 hypothetical protein D0T23_07275 [Duganella sp. BJB475]RFP36141.1 hypothetical protein D0T21_06820 [Duganella sp. BJB476]
MTTTAPSTGTTSDFAALNGDDSPGVAADRRENGPLRQFVPRTADEHLEPARGDGDQVVTSGMCLGSIAEATGHFWETLQELPANKDVLQGHRDAHVLREGDRITVPPLKAKEEACAVNRRHRFRRKGVPEKLRLRMVDISEVMANQPYILVVNGERRDGTTDPDGLLDEWIAPGAQSATLYIGDDTYELQLGALQPASTLPGAMAHLLNLGYLSEATEVEEQIRTAIGAFQVDRFLEPTFALDETTVAAIEAQYTHWSATANA